MGCTARLTAAMDPFGDLFAGGTSVAAGHIIRDGYGIKSGVLTEVEGT